MEKQAITISAEELNKQQDFCGKIRQFYMTKSAKQPLAMSETYGCQQNEADTELLRGMLVDMGFGFTDEVDKADFIFYNTCAVREHAETRVFGKVGEMFHAKAKNRDLIVAICGCMAQQEHISEKIRKSFPVVDMVFGTHALYKFPENFYKRLVSKKRVFDLSGDENGKILEGISPVRPEGSRAWLSIMYGCNNFCSYCIVPYVRGRERSRRVESVKAEFESLVKQGYREITLLGQNVNSYGTGGESSCDFADLLQMLAKTPGDYIIRFMTSHPKDATEKLFAVMSANDKIAKQLHLPFQSGSNDILEKMNRRYTREKYIELVEKAREYMPNVTITSDVIVGFPNETEEDFEQTVSLIKQIKLDGLYTFIYSPRVGTVAASIEDKTPLEDKKRRFERLLSVQNEISGSINSQYVGTTQRVLVDGASDESGYPLTARTEGQKLVRLSADAKIGEFIDCEITGFTTWTLFGKA